jgi:hypothetical protein
MSNYKTFPGYQIFPIKSDTACLLKWSWSTISMETGYTGSCHRTEKDPIDPDDFDSFHNIPSKIKARQDMQNGLWPGRGCEYCKNVEMHGGVSDRQMNLMREHGLDKIPPELLADPASTSVTPIILEIYFNNTCNLSCAYCSPSLSSKWNDEIKKFGPVKIANFEKKYHQVDTQRYDKMVKDLWKYLETDERYKIIRHFHLLGGESFYQKELDQCLDFWAKHPNGNLSFNMISNLIVPHKIFSEKIDSFSALVKSHALLTLELTASLDCLGPEQEYVRHGMDLDLWIKNFEFMLDKPEVRLAVHSVVSSLTIKTLPDLIEKINFWNQRRPPENAIEHNFDVVKGCDEIGLHPHVFGPGVFDQDFERILAVMPESNDLQITVKKQMAGVANYIKNSKRNSEKIKNLKDYLDELDRRRATNWRDLFAWLDKID